MLTNALLQASYPKDIYLKDGCFKDKSLLSGW